MRFVKVGVLLMGAGVVMLVGAIIGFSAHAPAVGITFMILMVACAGSAFAVGLVFRSQARKWRDEQVLAAEAAGLQEPPDFGRRR
jgi:uncharacterized membrane protein